MEIGSAFVTGSNRGLGLELVKQLVNLPKPPKYVFATHRNLKTAQALKEIADSSKQCQVVMIKMDIENKADISAARQIAEEKLGDEGLNLLVNNAGILQAQRFADITDENMLLHFKTNTLGPVAVLKEMLPLLQKAAAHHSSEMSVSNAMVLNMASMDGSTTAVGNLGDQAPDWFPSALGYRVSKIAALSTAIGIIASMLCYIPMLLNCDPVVYVGRSQITGLKVRVSDMAANQFLKVPYAEPPIGDLRFQKTKPMENLPHRLKADRQPPACPQYTQNPFPWYINSTEKSEDCLYLNIWTPTDASPENTKAVFYWIHGGGFRYGSIRDPLYSGIALAALDDVVVVTVNYRLGPFGFLSSGTDDAPGNAGLWDLLEGLKWVNRNIRAFGGDTSRITIAGESVGSIAAAMLAASPLSKDLFTRIIMESGSPLAPRFEGSYEKNLVLAQNLSVLLECADDGENKLVDNPFEVIRCLKAVDADTLSRTDSLLQPRSSADFYPQYGDEILPTYTKFKVMAGKEFNGELLIGVNKDEGSLLLTTGDPDVFGFFGQKDPQINKTAGKDMIRKIHLAFPDPDALANHYLPDSVPDDSYQRVRRQVYTSLGDTFLVCPTVYYAEEFSEKGNDVYFFYWMHRPSPTPWARWMGVTHFSKVPFLFGQPLLNTEMYQPEEVEISLNMIQMWSNFVKSGKPSLDWPLFSKDSRQSAPIGLETDKKRTDYGSHLHNCDCIRAYSGV